MKNPSLKHYLLTCCFMFVSLSGTGHANTLYEDFGGKAAIDAVSEQFLWNLAQDKRISHHWADSNIDRFHEKMQEHLCELMEGPCEYTGDNMRRTHKGMQIDQADFYAVSENLIEAMETVGVPTGAQNRLLKILIGFYEDIIKANQPQFQKSSLP